MKSFLVFLFVLVLASCGGSGGNSSGADSPSVEAIWDETNWDEGEWK
tara:strand:- start:19011 stop:19151 length:141 start_codon:yes stop_codon:yes gene_type:complete